MTTSNTRYRIFDPAHPLTEWGKPEDYRMVFYYSRKLVTRWCSHKRHCRDENELPTTACAIPNCNERFCELCQDKRPACQSWNYCECHQIRLFVESDSNILVIGLGPTPGEYALSILEQVVEYRLSIPTSKVLLMHQIGDSRGDPPPLWWEINSKRV